MAVHKDRGKRNKQRGRESKREWEGRVRHRKKIKTDREKGQRERQTDRKLAL